jgi:hypothetical protein
MKALTIRVPLPVWQACIKRMADDLIGWHDLLLPVIEEYARGGNPVLLSPASEELTEIQTHLNSQYDRAEVQAVLSALLSMLRKQTPRR